MLAEYFFITCNVWSESPSDNVESLSSRGKAHHIGLNNCYVGATLPKRKNIIASVYVYVTVFRVKEISWMSLSWAMS